MAIIFRHTTATCRTPATAWHLHIIAATGFGFRADLAALRTPNRIVPMSGANECVRDLVEERVEDRVVGVAFGEVDRELDATGFVAMRIEAHPGTANVRVEPELPGGQPVFREQSLGQFANRHGAFTESERNFGRHGASPGVIHEIPRDTEVAAIPQAHLGPRIHPRCGQ